MTNATFRSRMDEISLNQNARMYDNSFEEMLDEFSPNMWYIDKIYGSVKVTSEFLKRLPEFRKWARENGRTWFRTWEQREAYYDSPYCIDTKELEKLISSV